MTKAVKSSEQSIHISRAVTQSAAARQGLSGSDTQLCSLPMTSDSSGYRAAQSWGKEPRTPGPDCPAVGHGSTT